MSSHQEESFFNRSSISRIVVLSSDIVHPFRAELFFLYQQFFPGFLFSDIMDVVIDRRIILNIDVGAAAE